MTIEIHKLPEISSEEVPSWINDQLFYDCLEAEYPNSESFSTKIISVRPAVPPGENYVSKIYRIKVEVNDGSKSKIQSFIIKQLLESAAETFKDSDVFKKEAIMYTDLLPEFVKYFAEVGEVIEFGPKLYKVLYDPERVFIFEDLNERNYFMKDRRIGLDLAHSKMFIEKLAKFHAASVVYYEKNGPYDPTYFTSMYMTKAGDAIKGMINSMFPYFLEAIQNNAKLCHLYDKIKNWMPNLMDEITELFRTEQNALNVLNHGDVWTNNFLFSCDENQNPNDILFIDYQISFWGSPISDIYMNFALAAQPDVKKNEFDNLVSSYYKVLTSSLKKLKYSKNIPSLRELHIELLKKGIVCASAAVGLAIMSAEGSEDSNFENLIGQHEAGEKFRKSIFQSTRYYAHVEALYSFLDKRGLIDRE